MHVKTILLTLVLVIVFCSCQNKNAYYSEEFFAMDTFISITANSASKKDLSQVKALLKQIESTYSKTKPDSVLTKLHMAKSAEVSEEAAAVFSKITEIAKQTDGYFHPALGRLIELWDITGKKHVPTERELLTALESCPFPGYTLEKRTVTLQSDHTKLDFGAVIKGYAAQKAIEQMKKIGIKDAMINLGGNIAVTGSSSLSDTGWRIGIRNPFYPDTIAASLLCTDTVIAVSGAYERYFEQDGIRYHHIFDPSTGYPASNGIVSTVVISEDGLIADALSTALFVMGKEKSIALYQNQVFDFEAILFLDDGKITVTDGLKNKVTLFEDAMFSDTAPLQLEQ